MKKSIRILAVVMAALMLCLALAGCGKKLSGEYYMGDKKVTKSYTTYSFDGNEVTCEVFLLGKQVSGDSFKGNYKIDGDEIVFTWKNEDGKEKSSTLAFEELENGNIKIGLVEFQKSE